MYVESHSESKYVQTEDHTLRQEEFSTSVDEDDFCIRYGEMDDEKFHHMMQTQDINFTELSVTKSFYSRVFVIPR